MKTYTVKEVANIFKTNPETVRRWIRSGKMKSTMTATKSGNIISEESLNAFVKSTPKYATLLSGNLINSPTALSFVVGGLLGGLINSISHKSKKRIDENDVRQSIERQINACQKRLDKNMTKLSEFEAKIEEDKKALQQFNYALAHLDLKIIAKQINDEAEKDEEENHV